MSDDRNPISPPATNTKHERRMEHHAASEEAGDIDKYVSGVGAEGTEAEGSGSSASTTANNFRAAEAADDEMAKHFEQNEDKKLEGGCSKLMR